MGNIFKHLGFLLTATNHHGVHSPFVYSFVTECLYKFKKNKKQKTIDILFKSTSYFEGKSIFLSQGYEKYKEEIRNEFSLIQFEKLPFDLLLLNASAEREITTLITDGKTLHNDSMILIDSIHKTSRNQKLWHLVKTFSQVTVTIDLYYCGVVFFRKEQVKEHFKIRI